MPRPPLQPESLPPVPSFPPTHASLEGARLHKAADGTPYLLVTDHAGGIRVVAMNRPKVKNAFDDWLFLALADMFNHAAADESVKVVVLTGAGDIFTSGADLKQDGSLKLGEGFTKDPTGVFMRTMLRFPKPIVAAVNGDAIGIGSTLLAHCDIVYSVDTAVFWTPFSRIALVPEFCSTVLFPRIMGFPTANEMLLFGKKISALRAERVGLVGQTFPKVGFMDRVLDEVREALAHPLSERSLPLYKALIKEHDVDFLERVCVYELDTLDRRAESGETAEAVIAFLKSQAAAKGTPAPPKKAKM